MEIVLVDNTGVSQPGNVKNGPWRWRTSPLTSERSKVGNPLRNVMGLIKDFEIDKIREGRMALREIEGHYF